MKKISFKKIVENTLKYFAKNSANSTTSGVMFQPVAPEKLKEFSKVNDQ